MNKNLKEKIINLRKKGLSQYQIKKQLNCSSSTVSYHCSERQRHNTNLRRKKSRKNNPLRTKLSRFKDKTKQKKFQERTLRKKTVKQMLKQRIKYFSRKSGRQEKKMFNENQLLEKIGENPVCYLTGRAIDLNDPKSYNLDHIMPRSKGGDNSLNNCQIACRDANQAKSDLTYEDFVQLCREVVAYYEENKNTYQLSLRGIEPLIDA